MTLSTVWTVILKEATVTEYQGSQQALKNMSTFCCSKPLQKIHFDKVMHGSRDEFMRMPTTTLLVTVKN